MGPKSTLRLMRTLGPSLGSLAQFTWSLLSNALTSLKLMLQTSTIYLLNLSSKINHSRTIMTSPATDTIPDGGITLISNGLALNNNNSSLLLPSKILLVQVDHTFLPQCNNNCNNSINRDNNPLLRPLLNLHWKN
ncbi:hypothetical protein GmHk_14G041558 [Glycine max]|nr:hypothetical protein GmHk_14G041558 [Glycine max]